MKKVYPSLQKDLERSRLIAQQAEKDEGVTRFRQEVLRGKLLESAHIPNWIRETHAIDSKEHTEAVVITSNRRCFIEWGANGWVQRLPLRRRGNLHHLHDIAVELSKKYGWQKAQAVHFVLSNAIPSLSSLSHIARIDGFTINVHHYVSPRELADYYRELRKEYGFKNQRNRAKATELNSKATAQQQRRSREKLLTSGVDRIKFLDMFFGAKTSKSTNVSTNIAMKRLGIKSRSTLYRHAKNGKIQRFKKGGASRWKLPTKAS